MCGKNKVKWTFASFCFCPCFVVILYFSFCLAKGLLKDIKKQKNTSDILQRMCLLIFVRCAWEFVGKLGGHPERRAAAMHLSPTREPIPHDNKNDILRRRANCSAKCGSPMSPWCNDQRWIWWYYGTYGCLRLATLSIIIVICLLLGKTCWHISSV